MDESNATHIASLTEALVKRELDKQAQQVPASVYAPREPERGAGPMKALSPGMLSTIGSLMDATGTYVGMKSRRGQESNPVVNAIAKQNPEITGALAVGSRPLVGLLTKLVRKASPGVADALQTNLGMEQAALGSNWIRRITGDARKSGFETHADMLDHWTAERNRRK